MTQNENKPEARRVGPARGTDPRIGTKECSFSPGPESPGPSFSSWISRSSLQTQKCGSRAGWRGCVGGTRGEEGKLSSKLFRPCISLNTSICWQAGVTAGRLHPGKGVGLSWATGSVALTRKRSVGLLCFQLWGALCFSNLAKFAFHTWWLEKQKANGVLAALTKSRPRSALPGIQPHRRDHGNDEQEQSGSPWAGMSRALFSSCDPC